MREYSRKNAARQRSEKLLRAYGIDEAKYQEMLAAQGGCCAICGNPPTAGRSRRLFVDHHHATGKVRGLLCHGCNTAIGLMEERTDRLASAIAYLNRTGSP